MIRAVDLLPHDLPGFAAANGWSYEPTADPPALGHSLWEQVSQGTVHNRIRGDRWEAGRITGGDRTARRVEKRGAWTVTTSVSISIPQASIDLGYLSIRLPRRMPHMVLDATANDRGPFSSLLKRPRADQRLSLEGDFDSHFRLYTPNGYETDALYVFTPDFMALLIDETGDLDVEIRDDHLVVYRPGGFDLADVATWERFERLRRILAAKAWDRTVLYADDHDPADLAYDIAEPGRRLRQRAPRIVWLAVGIPIGILALGGAITAIVLTAVPW
ncbi:hypothetical protein [Microbacterium soli]|uniref:Uncharacterized protein n=1 Tax=Microbacterium soli TaxID=446075 RepID=A0ABP7NH18_9MICO